MDWHRFVNEAEELGCSFCECGISSDSPDSDLVCTPDLDCFSIEEAKVLERLFEIDSVGHLNLCQQCRDAVPDSMSTREWIESWRVRIASK